MGTIVILTVLLINFGFNIWVAIVLHNMIRGLYKGKVGFYL